ncbi:MAG: hypothetical protein WB511_09955 [Nitrososphaeraceae archaeon]
MFHFEASNHFTSLDSCGGKIITKSIKIMYEHKTMTPGVGLEPYRFASGFVLEYYHSRAIITAIHYVD